MSWKQRYKVRSYLRSSLWIVPVAAGMAERVFRLIVTALEPHLGWVSSDLGVDGAKALTNAVVTLTLSFVVFTFGSLLVAIQVASGQYTPRIIATTLLRDNHIRCIVAYFVFTLLLALRMANQIDAQVNQFDLLVAGILGLLSIMLFLYFIDHAARMLRPVTIVACVARNGLAVIDGMYPQLPSHAPSVDAPSNPVTPARIV